ncbi:MAG: hypothetical protein OIF57_07075, partial [Marinobacterium sp.]|nr:hypothetical protein [Marinobacterium sp.]
MDSRYTGPAFSKLALVVAMQAALTGCLMSEDSDSGSVNSGNTGSANGVVSGQAIDGYLNRARACIDANKDGICGEGEANTLTDERGYFELDGSSSPDSAVVVEVIPGITVDMDRPAAPLEVSYSLTSPPGKNKYVTPVTTMVRALQQAGQPLEQAEQQVRQQLSLSEAQMVYEDFVAMDSAEGRRMHAVSQVIVQVVSSTVADSTTEDMSTAEQAMVTALAMRKVATGQLEVIRDTVAQRAGDDGAVDLATVDAVSQTLFQQSRSQLVVTQNEVAQEQQNPGSVAAPVTPAPQPPVTPAP